MANAFTNMGNDQYAIRTYERARDLLRNPYLYGSPLARLYAKNGDVDKSVNALLDGAPGQPGGIEEVKTTLLEMLGTDAKKQQQAQKAIVKRINAQPESAYYADLLTWLYTQRGDWEGALIQIQALDERNREGGQRMLEFSREAQKQSQYDIAVKALDAVIEKGNTMPFYAAAKTEKLNVAMRRLENDPFYKPEDVTRLSKEYESFFAEFPQFYATETLRDYATLEAQYNNNPQQAIDLLQKAIDQPSIRKDLAGRCKLQMGDYTVLIGKIWDASLLYSQVDKAFREDILGEEARFRNAKLAYYRGDFDWAQGQLSVLKASTSELIANDALYLSVLITENVAPDSNVVPLQRFAAADLLLFQNKTKDAETLLDSISQAFPKHPLNDDILMLRAELEEKRHNYTKAIDYLKQVYGQYGKDVLGDDAVFKTAEIYHQYLHQDAEAKALYEQLIIDYPGSTFVQTARQRLQALQPATP
jgi:tetratricopeptide (TPR) repeat protein